MTTPSYWRDESATLAATERSIPQLLFLLHRVDAVHGFYYLLMWPVVHLAGSGEFATRLPSAIAMAAAAVGTVMIGRGLRSRRSGLYAGLVFAALPLVGLQGQDARPYAFETAAAVLATCLLVRAAARPTAPRLAGYGLSLVTLGYLHLFGLLIIPAHAIALIPVARLERARHLRQDADASDGCPGTSPGTGAQAVRIPGLLSRWVVTVVLACLAMAPLVSLGWHQRGAISWLPKPGTHDVAVLIGSFAAGTVSSAVIFGAIALLGVVRADWPDKLLRSPAGQARDAADRAPGAPGTAPVQAWAGRPEWALTAAALPWMVLPPAILLIAAQFKPVYELRYLEYCLPAVALLVGAGIASTGWPLRFAVLAMVVVVGLPLQYDLRQPLFNGYIRNTAEVVAQYKKAGDAIYFPDPWGVPTWDNTYPQMFSGVRVIQQAKPAAQTGRLVGQNLPLGVIEQRLKGVHRLWVAEMTGAWQNPPFPLKGFRLALSWQRNQMWLRLYVRVPPHHHHHRYHHHR